MQSVSPIHNVLIQSWVQELVKKASYIKNYIKKAKDKNI